MLNIYQLRKNWHKTVSHKVHFLEYRWGNLLKLTNKQGFLNNTKLFHNKNDKPKHIPTKNFNKNETSMWLENNINDSNATKNNYNKTHTFW